jgi:hypothetical protein
MNSGVAISRWAPAGVLVLSLAAWWPASETSAAQQAKPHDTKQTEQKPQDTKQMEKDAAVMTTTAGAIAQNPATYYGKKVEVRAEVEDVLGRQVFLLDEDRLFAWPDVMVIAPALTGYAPEDEMVTVRGTVKAFVDADFRRDYAWNWWGDLHPNVVVAFRDRPAIVAESIRTSTGAELVRAGTR